MKIEPRKWGLTSAAIYSSSTLWERAMGCMCTVVLAVRAASHSYHCQIVICKVDKSLTSHLRDLESTRS